MKVLLINPPSSDDESQISVPLSLLILQDILRQELYHVDILDLDMLLKTKQIANDRLFFMNVLELIKLKNTKIIGITTNCCNYPIVIELAKKIKEYDKQYFVFLGGPQASMCFESTLKEFDFIDLIVVGEGEETIRELAKKQFCVSSNILGLGYINDNEIIYTGKRPLLKSIESSTNMFDEIALNDYWDEIKNHDNAIIPIEIGRGCPYNCSFCCTSIFWDRKYRVKDINCVIKEINYIKKVKKIDRINFVHDNLTFDNRYCESLCSRLIDEKIEVNWNCSSRIDQLNTDLLNLMVKAGCKGIFFGIETGSESMQIKIRKNLNLTNIQTVLKEVISRNINATVSFIIGFPDETEEDLNSTLELALKCRLLGASVELQLLSPMVGTEIFELHNKTCFYTETQYQRLWYNDNLLDIHKIMSSKPEIFNFFYSFKNVNISYEKLVITYLLFLLIINNNPNELNDYLVKYKYKLLDLYDRFKHKDQHIVISKGRDKIDFFSKAYNFYSLVLNDILENEQK